MYNYNSAVVSPKNSNVITKNNYNSGIPPNQNLNSPIQTIINYNFDSQRNNNNNTNNTNRGTIRSALKFDYEQAGMMLPKEKVEHHPSMNIFSFLDKPNYNRDFEVTPKLMHK